MKRYIPVFVLTNTSGYDCSANGVTATSTNRLVIEHPRGHISEDDVAERDYIVLDVVTRNIGKSSYTHAEPKGINSRGMAGGNFIYSTDSRFREISQYPLSVHDRVEG